MEIEREERMATFKSVLKKAINEAGINQKELAEMTGISTKSISDYVHGTIPTPEKRAKIESVLNIEPLPEESRVPKTRYPLEEAANKLSMSLESLKIGLINNLFNPQIGVAIPHGKQYSYTIFEKRLDKYLEGADIN